MGGDEERTTESFLDQKQLSNYVNSSPILNSESYRLPEQWRKFPLGRLKPTFKRHNRNNPLFKAALR